MGTQMPFMFLARYILPSNMEAHTGCPYWSNLKKGLPGSIVDVESGVELKSSL